MTMEMNVSVSQQIVFITNKATYFGQ